MKSIQFTYANYRYLTFQDSEQYFLLDRSPSHPIGYLFMPLSWSFYQKVYPITADDYFIIKQKLSNGSTFALPISVASAPALGVSLSKWVRINNFDRYFETDFSASFNVILVFVAVFLSFVFARFVYDSRKRSMSSLIHTELTQPLYYKIRPSKISFKVFLLYIIYLLIIIGVGMSGFVVFLYLENSLALLAATFALFLHLIAVNLAYSAENGRVYKIVDILPSKD